MYGKKRDIVEEANPANNSHIMIDCQTSVSGKADDQFSWTCVSSTVDFFGWTFAVLYRPKAC